MIRARDQSSILMPREFRRRSSLLGPHIQHLKVALRVKLRPLMVKEYEVKDMVKLDRSLPTKRDLKSFVEPPELTRARWAWTNGVN